MKNWTLLWTVLGVLQVAAGAHAHTQPGAPSFNTIRREILSLSTSLLAGRSERGTATRFMLLLASLLLAMLGIRAQAAYSR